MPIADHSLLFRLSEIVDFWRTVRATSAVSITFSRTVLIVLNGKQTQHHDIVLLVQKDRYIMVDHDSIAERTPTVVQAVL